MKILYITLLVINLIAACNPKKSKSINDNSIGIDKIIPTKSIEKTNVSKKIEEEYIMDEMEFMTPIENYCYFGVVIGNQISDNQNFPRSGGLETG